MRYSVSSAKRFSLDPDLRAPIRAAGGRAAIWPRMFFTWFPFACLTFIVSGSNSFAVDHVIINEIHYHPVDDALTEFIELYNPTGESIDLSGYMFTSGVTYSFRAGTRIPAGQYFLVVRDPSQRAWRSVQKAGPYRGKLSNKGESIILRAPDGRIVESFTYSDDPPWPRGPDGYGPTLERISPDLPAHDYHSWRASIGRDGTPGRPNSVRGTPPRPLIRSVHITPQHPTSHDAVQIRVELDGPGDVDTVTLHVETNTTREKRPAFVFPMQRTEISQETASFVTVVPAQPSQTLVRFAVEVAVHGGKTVRLPHVAEPRPFESYFVYDGEIPSRLPILWIFHPRTTDLPGTQKIVSGVVIKPLDGRYAETYDGARVINSHNGNKIKFLKGEEYRLNRTLNLIPESPPVGTTAGPQSPHVEHISYRIYRDFGVLAPECEWYRVIQRGAHKHRIAIQQPNEQFLAINNRDRTGNVYKIAYNEPGGYTKKTNLDEGDDDFRELFRHVNISNRRNLSEDLRRYLVIEEVMSYEVVTNLLSHWDGIKNNIFLYHNPPPIDKWEIIPWDIDKTFGYLDTDPMYWKMPVDFPKTGYAPGPEQGAHELNYRNLVGPISRPFHMDDQLHQEYRRRVRGALDGLFSIDRMSAMIDEVEQLLLTDLDLLESYTGTTREERRNQIKKSYDTMRFFIRMRHQFLRSEFPTLFEVSRYVPSDTYVPGVILPGIKLTIRQPKGTRTTLRLIENIPGGFSASNISASEGSLTFISNTIVWQLADWSGTAWVTYDLVTPRQDAPRLAEIHGSVWEAGTQYPIEVTTLKHASGLGPDWVAGSGVWIVSDGVLTCFSDSDHDPKHIWLNKNFGTGNYTVKADVRMLDWRNADLARAGVAVRINPDDGERGLNILYHQDTGSVDLLNDLVSWGTSGNYHWEVNEWYTMTLRAEGSLLEGTIKRRGSREGPYVLRWDDPRNALRSPGFPGLTGSSLAGLSAQFDNFQVIVDGVVVYSDSFDSTVGITDWQFY